MRRLAFGLALAVLAAACAAPVFSAPVPAPSASGVSGNDAGLGEQNSEAGSVTVVVSWSSGDVPTARVVMDTHSVDLDGLDLKDLARVRLDGSAWIVPSGWDAPAGGHHRSGMLAFASLSRSDFDAAKLIELELRDVAAPSRLLRWERAR